MEAYELRELISRLVEQIEDTRVLHRVWLILARAVTKQRNIEK